MTYKQVRDYLNLSEEEVDKRKTGSRLGAGQKKHTTSLPKII